MSACWRMSPLVLVALVALRLRWLAGLLTRSGGRPAAAPSWVLSLLRASGSMISQFFVWVYVLFGAILILTLASSVLKSVIGEIKLQRECARPLREVHSDRLRAVSSPSYSGPAGAGVTRP